MFKVKNKDINQSGVNEVFLGSIVAFETHFSSVFIVGFQQVNVGFCQFIYLMMKQFPYRELFVVWLYGERSRLNNVCHCM